MFSVITGLADLNRKVVANTHSLKAFAVDSNSSRSPNINVIEFKDEMFSKFPLSSVDDVSSVEAMLTVNANFKNNLVCIK